MKIICISEKGFLLPIAERLQKDGHAVTLITASPIGKDIVKTIAIDNSLQSTITSINPDYTLSDIPLPFTPPGRLLYTSVWNYGVTYNPKYAKSLLNILDLPVKPIVGRPYILEGWFNGLSFSCITQSYIFDRLLTGDLGPTTQLPMGIISKTITKDSWIYTNVLERLEKPLRKIDYRGPIQLTCMISGTSISVSSINAMFSPITYLTLEQYKGTTFEFIQAVSNDTKDIKLDSYGIGVLMTFPVGRKYSVAGINEASSKHIYKIDMESDTLTAGITNIVGYACAHSNTLRECVRRVYRTIDRLEADDIQYRIDITDTTIFD